MKILSKKQQKEILRRVILLEALSIRMVEPEVVPTFADHLTEISLIVGGAGAMEYCVDAAKEIVRKGGIDGKSKTKDIHHVQGSNI